MQKDEIQEIRDTLISINLQLIDIGKMYKKVEEHEIFINQIKGGLAVILASGVILTILQIINFVTQRGA